MVDINRAINAFLVFRLWKTANTKDVIMPFYHNKTDNEEKKKKKRQTTAKANLKEKGRKFSRVTPSAPSTMLLPEQRSSFIREFEPQTLKTQHSAAPPPAWSRGV